MVRLERRTVVAAVLRAVLVLVVSALLAAPLAVAWGVGRAEITDYLGANQVTIAVDYTGETRLDLGPLGNAYLPMSYGPAGLTITVGGLHDPAGGSILSTSTLQSYLNLYNDPQEAVAGIRDGLVSDAIGHALGAEIVLVLIMIGWTQRRHFLSPRLVRLARARHGVLGYLMVVIIVFAVAIAPPARPPTQRYPLAVADGTRFAGMTVDSDLLAELLDRGVKGVRKMAARQNAAIVEYVARTTAHLNDQLDRVPEPGSGEEMIFGISDLHCNLAMTRFWSRLVGISQPAAVFSSGDDTVNGTATERSCVTGERAVAAGRPFIDIGGNHDSQTTEKQMRSAGATVLDGKVTGVAGIDYLGDDDPEYNPPFSTDRIAERSETEQQLGERMTRTATGRNVDVILVHQPNAAQMITSVPNPPAKLVAWGHMHVQDGPHVIMHADRSWTVAVQLGTAGGVAAPTITSFSTPFSPPRTSADGYFFFRDRATGLITGVQPVHCLPDASVIIDDRIPTGDLAGLPPQTRDRLGGEQPADPIGTTSPGATAGPAGSTPAAGTSPAGAR
jgi:predicted phosphodiesterase